MVASRLLPYLNFALASTSLGVQIGILYPWHEELDRSFERLTHEHARQLEDHHHTRMKALQQFKDELTGSGLSVKAREHRGWFDKLWRWERDDLKGL